MVYCYVYGAVSSSGRADCWIIDTVLEAWVDEAGYRVVEV
jgi:hypothetical protein